MVCVRVCPRAFCKCEQSASRWRASENAHTSCGGNVYHVPGWGWGGRGRRGRGEGGASMAPDVLL